MSMQLFDGNAARIGKFKGRILKHAEPREVLSKHGRTEKFPKNNSKTYVARRFLPYGATTSTASTQNRFSQQIDGTGDRSATVVQAHQVAEGVTPTPEGLTPVDVTVVMQQYACLFGYTDVASDFYEDNYPKEMTKHTGERVTLVNELVIYGELKACTNTFYGGTGTSIATVNGGLTLNLIQRIVRNLQANHAMEVTKILKASGDYGTDPVEAGYFVFGHTNLEPDIRRLTGFTPTVEYASGTPLPFEVGKCQRFRFILSPELVEQQDAGASVGGSGFVSTSGSSIDVYPVIVMAEDAWSHVAVRGTDSIKPTFLPTGVPSKSDQFGQRGYVGAMWWKGVLRENNGWMAVAYVASVALTN
jgi:N4-gp56 family major capsid protein